MAVKADILKAIKEKFANDNWDPRSQINQIIEEKEFFLQKGQDAYNNFMDTYVNTDNLNDISSAIAEAKIKNNNIMIKLDEINNIFDRLDMDMDFRNRLWTLMSYLVENCPNKEDYNQYLQEGLDTRDVVYIPGGPNLWLVQLIQYRASKNIDILNNATRYTLEFIANPMNNISIVSRKHRETLSNKLLGKNELDDNNFCADIKDVFSDYEGVVMNPINFSILCARLLYDKDITSIWQDKSGSGHLKEKVYLMNS